MGLPLAKRLKDRHSLRVFDSSEESRKAAAEAGLKVDVSIESLVKALAAPRLIWIMVPMGNPVDEVIASLIPHVEKDDIVADGGNADFKDSIRRKNSLKELGLHFVGAGVSGGLAGAQSGPPITLDCDPSVFKQIEPVLRSFTGNFVHFEEPGFGHLAKMLHNAIEYGMMQSLAEGVSLYVNHGFTDEQLRDVFKVWSKGSIIESRLTSQLTQVLDTHSVKQACSIAKSETVKAVKGVLLEECNTPIIRTSAELREMPGRQNPVALTVLARLRNFFGGHRISGS
jgi:6-phosphogluconate dehydrogenase